MAKIMGFNFRKMMKGILIVRDYLVARPYGKFVNFSSNRKNLLQGPEEFFSRNLFSIEKFSKKNKKK